MNLLELAVVDENGNARFSWTRTQQANTGDGMTEIRYLPLMAIQNMLEHVAGDRVRWVRRRELVLAMTSLPADNLILIFRLDGADATVNTHELDEQVDLMRNLVTMLNHRYIGTILSTYAESEEVSPQNWSRQYIRQISVSHEVIDWCETSINSLLGDTIDYPGIRCAVLFVGPKYVMHYARDGFTLKPHEFFWMSLASRTVSRFDVDSGDGAFYVSTHQIVSELVSLMVISKRDTEQETELFIKSLITSPTAAIVQVSSFLQCKQQAELSMLPFLSMAGLVYFVSIDTSLNTCLIPSVDELCLPSVDLIHSFIYRALHQEDLVCIKSNCGFWIVRWTYQTHLIIGIWLSCVPLKQIWRHRTRLIRLLYS